jgi:hypothetical protein
MRAESIAAENVEGELRPDPPDRRFIEIVFDRSQGEVFHFDIDPEFERSLYLDPDVEEQEAKSRKQLKRIFRVMEADFDDSSESSEGDEEEEEVEDEDEDNDKEGERSDAGEVEEIQREELSGEQGKEKEAPVSPPFEFHKDDPLLDSPEMGDLRQLCEIYLQEKCPRNQLQLNAYLSCDDGCPTIGELGRGEIVLGVKSKTVHITEAEEGPPVIHEKEISVGAVKDAANVLKHYIFQHSEDRTLRDSISKIEKYVQDEAVRRLKQSQLTGFRRLKKEETEKSSSNLS